MGREAVPVENGADEMGNRVVAEAQRAAPLLECRWREQSTVQKRHRTEATGGRGAVAARCVERAEEQRTQQTLMQLAARLELRGGVMQQKVEAMIEPALGLEKSEKKTAAGAEQGEFASFGRRGAERGRAAHVGGERGDGAFEDAVKPIRERLAS